MSGGRLFRRPCGEQPASCRRRFRGLLGRRGPFGRLLDGRGRRGGFAPSGPGRIDAGAQDVHEVDDRRRRGLRLDTGHDLVPLALFLDERLDLLSMCVVVLPRVPLVGHGLEQQLGHGQLALAELDRVGHFGQLFLRRADLVGEVHRLELQHIVIRTDGDRVLLVSHDHRPDGHLVCGVHDLSQKLVGLGGRLTLRRQVVGRPEVDGVDLMEIDEIGDLDEPRLLRLSRLQLFVAQDHVLPAAQVEAPDDVAVVDLLAGPLVHLSVANPVAGAGLELVEVDGLVLGGGVDADRNVDQTEVERALPNCPCHPPSFTQVRGGPPSLSHPGITMGT